MLCECGKCGLEAKPGRRFLKGHNAIRPKSEETKKRISATKTGVKHSEGVRKKIGLGQVGRKHSDESKRKRSIALSGKNNPMYCKEISPQHRERLSEARKRRVYTPELRANISKALMRHIVSEQTRAKIGAKRKLRKNTPLSNEKRRQAFLGNNNPFFGKKHTTESLEKIKLGCSNNDNHGKYTNPTTEKIIHEVLSKLGMSFDTQSHIRISDGFRYVDFLVKPNIIIECDGDYYHSRLQKIRRDFIADYEFEKLGYKILRFWEYDIRNNLDWCIQRIKNTCGGSVTTPIID
jgi:very-short-patch-repair endonuclease